MEPPTIKPKESVNDYLRRLDQYDIYINKEKYNFLLDFINSWLKLKDETKRNSLTKFISITENNFYRDVNNNEKLIDNNKLKFKKLFGIDVEKINQERKIKNQKKDKDDDKTKKNKRKYDKYLIKNIVTIALSYIKYKMISSKRGKETYLTIKKLN